MQRNELYEMKPLKMIGLCLVAVFLTGTALAESASAAPAWEQCSEGTYGTKYVSIGCNTAENFGIWQWSEVTAMEGDTIKGSLKITDTKVPIIGKVAVLCSFGAAGYAGPSVYGKIYEIHPLTCSPGENCEKIEKETEPRNLPWETESYESEKNRVLQKLSSLGGLEPGWKGTCKVLGVTKGDECVAETGKSERLALENRATGLTLLVLATFQHTKLKCELGGKGAGEVTGQFAIESFIGAGLRVR